MSLLNICLFYGSNVVVVCRGLCSCWIRIHCWVRNRKLKKTDIICNSLSHATQLNMWKPTTSLEALVVKSDIQLGRVHLSLLHARSNLRIYSCRRQEVPFILQIRVASKLDYLFSQRCCSVLLSSTNGLNFFLFLFSWNLYTYIADHALTVKQWWWWMCDSIWSASYPAANAFYIFPATAAAATIYLFLKRKIHLHVHVQVPFQRTAPKIVQKKKHL